VAREIHLARPAEDTHAELGSFLLGRKHERRFRKIHLARNELHFFGREPLGHEKNSELIAGQRLGRKNIDVEVG
jgi:hypothetical protein